MSLPARPQSRVPSVWTWLARTATERTEWAIGGLGTIMLVAYVTAMVAFPKPDGRIVFGDATHHFVQLRSLVFDRDLAFQNEYMQLYGLRDDRAPEMEWLFSDLTATGHVRNYMPIGPALLWAPLYLAVAGFKVLLALVGLGAWPDGFDRSSQMAAGISGVVAATIGAWLSWRIARRFTGPTSAAVGVMAVWLGSHAIYYSMISPAYSHAASMLTSAVFVSCWLRWRESPSVVRLAGLGALAGVASLMRWQDVVFLAVPAIEAVSWRVPVRTRLLAGAAAAAGWLVVFSPQLAIWHVLYGEAFAVPQGPSFMLWTSPHPVAVLFSTNHGLFTWAPLLVPACAGLVMLVRQRRSLVVATAVVLLASWYVNAAVADWWAGEAYGARRFLSLFPLLVLGAASWIHAGERSAAARYRVGVLAALVIANGLLLLQYQLFMKGLTDVAPYPGGWFDMWLARFVVPIRLVRLWLG